MATTTNFGWTTPDDTDAVINGAAAIRTALNGVDTSLVDLKGGTTGQVLAKASNTDLDFTWAAPGSYTQIASSSMVGVGQVNFNSIPGDYRNLVLVIRDWYTSAAVTLAMTINGVSTSTYCGKTDTITGTTFGTDNYVSTAFIRVHGSTITADRNSQTIIEIDDYATAGNIKRIKGTTVATTAVPDFAMSDWTAFNRANTAAITSITLQVSTGTIVGGTAVLYGVR